MATQQAHGLMAPVHESAREIKYILNTKALYEHLAISEAIQEIKKIQSDQKMSLYLIETATSSAYVYVHYHVPEKKGFVGPRQFSIECFSHSH